MRVATVLACSFLLLFVANKTPASAQASRKKSRSAAPAPLFSPTAAQITFRVLLIIKPVADIRAPGFLPVRNRMPAEDIRAVTRAFREYFPESVALRTNRRVAVVADVVVSDTPLRTTDVSQDRQSTLVWGEDVYEDIDRQVPLGAYDGSSCITSRSTTRRDTCCLGSSA